MASEPGIFLDAPDHPGVDENLPASIDLAKVLRSIDLCMDITGYSAAHSPFANQG